MKIEFSAKEEGSEESVEFSGMTHLADPHDYFQKPDSYF